jgi:serine phosphatase RsbU (regulator of sigma subunit)
MRDWVEKKIRNLSLQQYLIIMIVWIIILVTGILLTISYMQAEDVIIRLDDYFQQYTEKNIVERVTLVDTGLKLSENTLNNHMEQAFVPFLDAYNESPGKLNQINFPALKHNVSLILNESADLYIINNSGIIISSTVPAVLYLNLSQSPDYAEKIPEMINGSGFVPDRVVRSFTDAHATNISGVLRKFGFMPTPDHQYLLEIGVADITFDDYQSNLSYHLISDEMDDINPYLDKIRIFNIHKNLFIKGGIIPSDQLDPVTNSRLDTVIATRSEATYYDTNSGNRTRYLFIDLTSPDTVSDMSVVAEVTYSNELITTQQSQILYFFSIVGCFSVFIGIILTIWASRLITNPISDIVADVDQIAQGDLDHKIRSMDVREIIRLEKSITLMIRQIRIISKEIERRKTELSIASDIQKSFLPDMLPVIQGFSIAARSVPAKEVGGDFYDVIRYRSPCISNDGSQSPVSAQFGILIADVSGKGVPAALFMALCRTIVRITTLREPDLKDAIAQANQFIVSNASTGMFVSLFYALVTEEGDTMTYINAGHNPPVHFHAVQQYAELLPEGGVVLGVDDAIQYAEKEIPIQRDDIIVFYTDGVTEAVNTVFQEYGTGRLMEVIKLNAGNSPEEILTAVMTDLSGFTRDCDQFDDITLVILKKDK